MSNKYLPILIVTALILAVAILALPGNATASQLLGITITPTPTDTPPDTPTPTLIVTEPPTTATDPTPEVTDSPETVTPTEPSETVTPTDPPETATPTEPFRTPTPPPTLSQPIPQTDTPLILIPETGVDLSSSDRIYNKIVWMVLFMGIGFVGISTIFHGISTQKSRNKSKEQ